MTVSQVLTRLVIGETVHQPSTVAASVDETRVPFARATVTVPYDPDTVLSLDPRTSPRLVLDLEVRYAGSDTLSDLSAQHAGQTLAGVSAAWAGLTLGDVSLLHADRWNGPGPLQPPKRRRMNLGVRSSSVRRAAGEVAVEACTDEQQLVDYALIADGPTMCGPSLRDAARLAIGTACPGAVLTYEHSQGRALTDPEARIWEPGVTAWEWLSPILATAGYRVWCDDSRIWHLAAADSVISYPAGALSTTQTVEDVVDTIDADAPGWATGVVVRYEWTTAVGARQVRYDVAGGGPRVISVRHDTGYPGPGEATWRLWAASRKGRSASVTAGLDPEVRAAMPTTLTTATGTLAGTTTGVQWSIPDDVMTVTIRDLEVL